MNNLQIETTSSEHPSCSLSLSGILTAALLYLGFGGSLFFAFYPDAGSSNGWFLALLGITVSFLVSVLSRFRISRIAGAVFLGALLLISLFFLDLPGGLCSIFNQISHTLGAHLGKNLTLLAGNDAAMPVAILWICMLLAFGCIWIVSTTSAALSWLLFLLLLILKLCLGLPLSLGSIALCITGLIFLRLPVSSQTHTTPAGMFTWLLLFALCGSTVWIGTALSGGHSFSLIHGLHEKADDALESYRYGETSDTGMPEGDFQSLGSLVQTDNSMLEITMDQPDSYYLRGFVGSSYSSDGWSEADPVSLYDGADLFYWLHKRGFNSLTQLSEVASLLDTQTASEASVHMQIKHTGASRKYIYAPYELAETGDLEDPNEIGDIRLESDNLKGLESYSLTASHNQVKRYATLSSMLKKADAKGAVDDLADYLTLESHYNRFVYEHFLEVPRELQDVLADILGKSPVTENSASEGSDGAKKSASDVQHLSYAQAKQTVLSWLNDNIQYAEVIPERDNTKDFLTEFLTDSKCGYDVHYASAAVMMMRYMGIPARYVEGYLITPDLVSEAEAETPFALTEKESHAWAEIYQDGIGWIPFEVTPKYLDVMDQEDALYGTGSGGEYRTSDSPNQDTPEEDSLEMDDDYHDDPEDEDEEEEEPDLIAPIIRLIITVGIVLLLLLLVIFLLVRSIAAIRKYRSFRLKDRRMAVRNLYTELHRLLGLTYSWTDCTMPSFFQDNIRQDLGEELALTYEDILSICEKAAFSSHEISEEAYQSVYDFVKQSRKRMKKRIGWKKKLLLFLKGRL